MTCIVAVREPSGRIVMGGDRALTRGSTEVYKKSSPKVARRGPILIGFAGDLLCGQRVLLGFSPPKRRRTDVLAYMVLDFVPSLRRMLVDMREDDDTYDDEVPCVELLVAYHGRLFAVDPDSTVTERTDDGFVTIGSGTGYAKGLLVGLPYAGAPKMSAEERVMLALETASRCTTTVAPPFDMLELPPPDSEKLKLKRAPARQRQKQKRR